MPELQAARGASLITAESSTPGSPAPPAGPDGRAGGRRATLLVLVVAIAAYVVDQVSKHLAVSRLTGHDPVKVVGSMLELTLLRNPGAAFSTGTSLTPLITLVAMIATVVVVWFALRVRHRGWAVALGLLLAGILGNLTDRMVRAHRARSAVTSSTSSRSRTGRCSTSPTSASTRPAC